MSKEDEKQLPLADFDVVADYVYDELLARGYVPTEFETNDVIDILLSFLVQEGVIGGVLFSDEETFEEWSEGYSDVEDVEGLEEFYDDGFE